MKVLQINCVYRYGSTGILTYEIHHHLLAQGIDSVVCYGRGDRSTDPGVRKICPEVYAKANNLLSRFRGTIYGGCHLSTMRLIRTIQSERPDVVHLQCINGYFVNIYKLVSWLKENRIKTVLTLHAEFMYTANCAHALDCDKWQLSCGHCPRLRQETHCILDGTARSFRKMQEAFRGFEKDLTVVSVSTWLRRRTEQSLILGKMPHRVIPNGVDTDIFTYRPYLRNTEEKVIFHATPMFSDDPSHLKGGWHLLELAKRLQGAPVRFLVAGKQKLRGPVPQNVTLLGEIRDRTKLAEYYGRADLTLLTSKRETFSMVCVESLCCGTPVVGFEAGAPEEICLPAFSEFVPAGDLNGLETAVRKWLDIPADRRQISAEAVRSYAREGMLREYTALYRGIAHEASG